MKYPEVKVMKKTIGFIGLGLIGGSIAKTIRRVYPEHKIIAYNRSENARTSALSDGTANIVTACVDSTFSECDYIFLCTPVQHNTEYLETLKNIIKDSCIITDVGSVKSNIHKAIIELGLEDNFIGGHPMAGSEKTGYENSTDRLIENAYYILTPTASTSSEQFNDLYEMTASLGAIPLKLDYAEHDRVVSAISHLPHLIASSLVNMVKDSDNADGIMKLLAAGGFKDITRIASSSPDMWEEICLTNSQNISDMISKYITYLDEAKHNIDTKNGNAIYQMFDSSGEYRNSFSDVSSGPIKKSYAVYCDIIDEAGAISIIASILASNAINIKNIGILHNREFEEGVLKIAFYDEESADKCVTLLEKYRYVVRKRS
ncbi:MAG: prephenate dehydrogenase/arogenate dehydrogenase family protein [Eubacterium sp.]